MKKFQCFIAFLFIMQGLSAQVVNVDTFCSNDIVELGKIIEVVYCAHSEKAIFKLLDSSVFSMIEGPVLSHPKKDSAINGHEIKANNTLAVYKFKANKKGYLSFPQVLVVVNGINYASMKKRVEIVDSL